MEFEIFDIYLTKSSFIIIIMLLWINIVYNVIITWSICIRGKSRIDL